MFLDIAIGILSAIFASWFFKVSLTASFLLAGITFALSPDLDYFLFLITGGRNSEAHKHRDILHYPLLFLPIGTVVLYPLGKEWMAIFILGTSLHFIHDMIGLGWGVKILWPFNRDNFALFFHYSPPGYKKLPSKLLYIWKPEEIQGLIEEYGDPNWFKNIYLRLNPILITELIVFLAAVLVLFFYDYKF